MTNSRILIRILTICYELHKLRFTNWHIKDFMCVFFQYTWCKRAKLLTFLYLVYLVFDIVTSWVSQQTTITQRSWTILSFTICYTNDIPFSNSSLSWLDTPFISCPMKHCSKLLYLHTRNVELKNFLLRD